jgi:hypothetical protein
MKGTVKESLDLFAGLREKGYSGAFVYKYQRNATAAGGMVWYKWLVAYRIVSMSDT